MRDRFHPLVEAADLNALLREVDGLCERREWEGLGLLEQMCRDATERGKQLWPIAEHINYRLVLEAPAEIAGPRVVPGAGRFLPGPLTEVAASTHSFAELAGHLTSKQSLELVAAERVLRGEDLSEEPRAHPEAAEVPLKLLRFEPAYRLARYRKDHVEVDEPMTPPPSSILNPSSTSPISVDQIDDEEISEGLLDLVRPWFEESGGSANASVVEGDEIGAIGALGLGEVASAPIPFTAALELMAWAASSGGAHGRRRGAAYGRFAAWWAASAICDLPWPPDEEAIEEEGGRLRWLIFDRVVDEPSGWKLGLACSSPEEGLACALYARDFEDSARDL